MQIYGGLLSAWTNGGERTDRCVDSRSGAHSPDAIALRIHFTESRSFFSLFFPPSPAAAAQQQNIYIYKKKSHTSVDKEESGVLSERDERRRGPL